MTTKALDPIDWTEVARPALLTRRFEFPAYQQVRAFLDQLGGLSKQTGVYPDLSFGRTHASVTVYGSDGAVVDDAAREFAVRAAALPAAAVA